MFGFKKYIVLLILIVFSASGYTDDKFSRPGFGIGFNYPGVGIRIPASDKFLFEGKYQDDSDVKATGLRLYRYFNTDANFQIFAGLEFDYLSFKGTFSDGNGTALEPMIGSEFFLSKRLSLQFDLGPAMISISDKNTSASVSGIEFVGNIGVNIYWRSK